jgi:RNA polymerase sigma factor (sigma-70 family)
VAVFLLTIKLKKRILNSLLFLNKSKGGGDVFTSNPEQDQAFMVLFHTAQKSNMADRLAFCVYFRDYFFRDALRILNNHHEAEDLAAEAILRLADNLDRCRGEDIGAVHSFAHTLCRNMARDKLRRDRRIPIYACGIAGQSEEDEEGDDLPSYDFELQTPPVYQPVELSAERRLVSISLNEIVRRKRKQGVLLIFFSCGLQQDEIANLLVIPIGTVKSGISHARETINPIYNYWSKSADIRLIDAYKVVIYPVDLIIAFLHQFTETERGLLRLRYIEVHSTCDIVQSRGGSLETTVLDLTRLRQKITYLLAKDIYAKFQPHITEFLGLNCESTD